MVQTLNSFDRYISTHYGMMSHIEAGMHGDTPDVNNLYLQLFTVELMKGLKPIKQLISWKES